MSLTVRSPVPSWDVLALLAGYELPEAPARAHPRRKGQPRHLRGGVRWWDPLLSLLPFLPDLRPLRWELSVTTVALLSAGVSAGSVL